MQARLTNKVKQLNNVSALSVSLR